MSLTRIHCAAALLALALAGPAAAAEGLAAGAPGVDAKAAFESIKKLAGEWQGNILTKDGPPATVRYALTAGGTAVLETQFAGTDHEMLSVYHLDGGDLVLVHYCAAGNQPRMRLDAAASRPGDLVFAFAGGTNLDPAKDAHVHGARIALVGDGLLETEWPFYQGGVSVGANKLYLKRAVQ